jgi:tetratricopeptide (TPR) repeat protein
MRRFFFFFLFSLIVSNIFIAQNPQIDSLKKLLFVEREDTQRVNEIAALSKQLILIGDFDSAMYYNQKANLLSSKIKFKKGLAVSYTYYGLIYFSKGNYHEAVKNYYLSLKLREELKDKAGIAATYHNLGNVYYSQKNMKGAMNSYQMSLKIKRETGDTLDSHYAHTINNLGNFYEEAVNFPEAMKYYEASIAIEKRIGDIPGLISAYGNVANVYIYLKLYDKAFENYYTILRLADSTGDKASIAAIYNSFGNLCYQLNRQKEALVWLEKGLDLSARIGSKEDIMTSYGYRTDVYAILKKYKESLADYKMWIAYRDSLNNEESTKKIVQAEMNYEFEKRVAATKLEQEKKEVIAAAESRKQKIIIRSVCGILLFVVAFAIFAFRSYRQKQKANIEITLQKEIIEQKQKEILDSINYASRIQRAIITSETYIERILKKRMR